MSYKNIQNSTRSYSTAIYGKVHCRTDTESLSKEW